MGKSDLNSDSIESLIPRLGDYLLDQNLITQDNLQLALDFQKSQRLEGKTVLLGQTLLQMGFIDAATLDKAVTQQVMDLHNTLKIMNSELEEKVQQRTEELQRRLIQIHTAADITQLAISATSSGELLSRIVNLIVDRFGYYSASIYLIDPGRNYLFLAETASSFGNSVQQIGQQIPLESPSIVSWAAMNNQPRISTDVRQEFFYHLDNLFAEIQSEVSIPIVALYPDEISKYDQRPTSLHQYQALVRPQVIGVLDVQHNVTNAFDPEMVAVLQVIANHIGSVIQNLAQFETTQQRLRETKALLKAVDILSNVKNVSEVFSTVARTLEESSYQAALLISSGDEMVQLPLHTDMQYGLNLTNLALPTKAQFRALFSSGTDLVQVDLMQPTSFPKEIASFLRDVGGYRNVLIPILPNEDLAGLIIIRFSSSVDMSNDLDKKHFSQDCAPEFWKAAHDMKMYVNLAHLAENTLLNIEFSNSIDQRLNAFKGFRDYSSRISNIENLSDLCLQTHHEIVQFMGKVDLVISINSVQGKPTINYYQAQEMMDEGQILTGNVAINRAGEKIASYIQIQDRSILMINSGDEEKQLVGETDAEQTVKSWLGVPLRYCQEMYGSMVVLSRDTEVRFNQGHLQFLEILALYLALFIQKEHCLKMASENFERERLLFDITNKIRGSKDVETIIRTTAQELHKALKTRRTRIDVDVDMVLQQSTLESFLKTQDEFLKGSE